MHFRKIVKKDKHQYDGKVYDLCVDESHSYNIDGLVVHNSGAGSLVNYALGITKVDPLQYDGIHPAPSQILEGRSRSGSAGARAAQGGRIG